MKMLVLNKGDETWAEVVEKLDEESIEAVMAICSMSRLDKEGKYHAVAELLDVIQVCIGALDKLAVEEEINIKKGVMLHREKLLKRGWNIKYALQITKKDWNK